MRPQPRPQRPQPWHRSYSAAAGRLPRLHEPFVQLLERLPRPSRVQPRPTDADGAGAAPLPLPDQGVLSTIHLLGSPWRDQRRG
ncbi:hypothetical protein [Ornithinimicrobium kibberense]|uniref:hypothetical protein n=1 Tax=Ornithinimicrobium kibberense TaxID=282060 RepID=UPI003608E57C